MQCVEKNNFLVIAIYETIKMFQQELKKFGLKLKNAKHKNM